MSEVAVPTSSKKPRRGGTGRKVILYFEVLKKPPVDYQLFLYRLDEAGRPVGATDYPQPALFWWPTSRWEAGDRRQVRVNTIPWWSGAEQTFGYALALSPSQASLAAAPWEVSARLPVSLTPPTANPPGNQPLEGDTLLPIAAFQRRAGLPYPQPLTVLPSSDHPLARQ
jgi:hypothetical protein